MNDLSVSNYAMEMTIVMFFLATVAAVILTFSWIQFMNIGPVRLLIPLCHRMALWFLTLPVA